MEIKKWHFVKREAKDIRKPRISSEMYLQFSEISEDVKEAARFARGILVDIGAGIAPYKPYFKNVEKYLRLDRFDYGGEKPDIIGDGSCLPLKSNSVDSVLCSQVLEHVPKPQEIVNETFRVLKKGGLAIFTIPMASPIHGLPHDYFRFTKIALEKILFQKFERVEVKENGGALLSIAQFIVWGLNEKLPKIISKPIITVINFVAKKLDKLFFSDVFTTNYIVIARK